MAAFRSASAIRRLPRPPRSTAGCRRHGRRTGASMPAVGSILTSCVLTAHRNSARIALRKWALARCLDRRSRPARITFGVMADSGALPAASSTCRYIRAGVPRRRGAEALYEPSQRAGRCTDFCGRLVGGERHLIFGIELRRPELGLDSHTLAGAPHVPDRRPCRVRG